MSIEYRKLGNSGTIVTKFCLGTMTFGAESDEATSHKLLDDYAKAAARFAASHAPEPALGISALEPWSVARGANPYTFVCSALPRGTA